jgi:hypothetical protein
MNGFKNSENTIDPKLDDGVYYLNSEVWFVDFLIVIQLLLHPYDSIPFDPGMTEPEMVRQLLIAYPSEELKAGFKSSVFCQVKFPGFIIRNSLVLS